jgi:hypothetical protein
MRFCACMKKCWLLIEDATTLQPSMLRLIATPPLCRRESDFALQRLEEFRALEPEPDLAQDASALKMHPTHGNQCATHAQVNMA